MGMYVQEEKNVFMGFNTTYSFRYPLETSPWIKEDCCNKPLPHISEESLQSEKIATIQVLSGCMPGIFEKHQARLVGWRGDSEKNNR